jgi:hypothetical protein
MPISSFDNSFTNKAANALHFDMVS